MLLLDHYSKGDGYKPFVTSDLSKGVFTSGSAFTFDATYRHGTVMPITLTALFKNTAGIDKITALSAIIFKH